MPIKYKYDSDNNIVYTHGIGEVTTFELKEYFEKILADEEIANGFWEIVNTKKVSNATFTFKDCVALSSLIKRFVREKDYQGALLYAPNRLSSHVIRLWFSLLRSVLSQTFCIETNLEKFQKLVHKHLKIKYDFNHI